jgi:hypothetical protein
VVAVQEQRELVTLLAGQRGRAGDHLLDVGVEVVIVALVRGAVCAAVTLAGVNRGDGRRGGAAGGAGRAAFTSLRRAVGGRALVGTRRLPSRGLCGAAGGLRRVTWVLRPWLDLTSGAEPSVDRRGG